MKPAFSLPNVYSDHMVFQRGKPIEIRGTASAGYVLQVLFDSESRTVETGSDGVWRAEFPAREAGVGHVIRVLAPSGATLELRDIAVGDVWIAGGQSNMEFPVVGPEFYGLKDGPEVAAAANDPDLRILKIQRMVSPDGPCDEFPLGAAWHRATTPEAVAPCSAVGYLFGKFLRKRLKNIPVGIISTNWGGCRIEPWIDEDTLRRHNCTLELAQIKKARDIGAEIAKGGASRRAARAMTSLKTLETWLLKEFFASDPATTKKALRSWAKPGIDLSDWTEVPGVGARFLDAPGVVWYRREVEIPEGWNKESVHFTAKSFNDTDEVFWDGVKIGSTWIDTPSYWSAPREYPVPARLAAPGRHTLAIRIANHFRSGGAGATAIEDIQSGSRTFLTTGKWYAKQEFRACAEKIGERPPAPGDPQENPRDAYTVPATLFNAMFSPLTPLRVRGALWYQGCSNSEESVKYASFQKYLVESWRKATRSPDMAFIQVQLSSFWQQTPTNRMQDDWWVDREPSPNPEWTEIREVQSKIRSLRLCDFVTAADIGDHSDIHPANKLEVARRLDAAAGKLLYGEKGVATGPTLASAKREGGAVRCSFTDLGAGLVAHSFAPGVEALVAKARAAAGKGKPSGRGALFPEEHAFAVAGADGKWVWAGAKIEGDTVLVSAPEVPAPVRVRYAWEKYVPSMRLFNKDGFPAFPFQSSVKRG